MRLSADVVFFGGADDGIDAEPVVDAVDGLIQAGEFLVFTEEEVDLPAGGQFDGVQPDAADPHPFA